MKHFLFCGPSGSGKTTIVHFLLKEFNFLRFSVSATTRAKRANETDGVDYYFLSVEDFKNKIVEDAFIEWEEVYHNGFYGTLKSEVERIWRSGKNVIFDVDVKGGISLKNYFGVNGLSVFVKVPSLEVLEQRLKARSTDSEDSLSQRLFKAKFEMTFADQFDEVLVNGDLPESLGKAQKLYEAFREK